MSHTSPAMQEKKMEAAAKVKPVAKAKVQFQARRHIGMFFWPSFWRSENMLQVGLAGQGLPSSLDLALL